MRVVTFNILSDDYVEFENTDFSKKYYQGLDTSFLQWSNRQQRVTEMIRDMDADVYLLQEVMTKARQHFVNVFGKTYWIGLIAYHSFALDNVNKNRTGNMIMIRKGGGGSKKPLFSDFEIGFGYRVAQCSTDFFDIYSIHLMDHTVNKYRQLGPLIEHIHGNRIHKRHIIIGGDFNTSAKRLHSMVEKRLQVHSAPTSVDGTYLCDRYTIDYIYSSLPMTDYVIVGKKVKDQQRRFCSHNMIAEIGSDHYPVQATV